MREAIIFCCAALSLLNGCGERRMHVGEDAAAAPDRGTDPLPPAPDAATSLPPAPDAAAEPPIAMTIENASPQPLFLDGLSAPFAVRDGDGVRRFPSVPWGSFACSRCAEQCVDNPMHGDPLPCYLELPPGSALTFAWNGVLHESGARCEECDRECIAQGGRIAAGEHTFEVPFRKKLDDTGYTFSEAHCALLSIIEAGGARHWQGDGIGVPQFDERAEVTIRYDGGSTIALRLGE